MHPADALAELRLRRDQVAAERARPPARWRLPLSMALAFGGHAVKELDGSRLRRPLSLALATADLAAMLPAAGERRVETPVAWLRQTLPAEAEPPAPELLLADRVGPRGTGSLVLVVLLASSALPRWLVPRLERRGVRRPHLVMGGVAALAVVPLTEVLKVRLERSVDPARTLPDVSVAASFPTGYAPPAEQAPLLADPDLLALAGLLAPAGGVSRSLLRELLGVDDATLGERLRAFDATGWVEPTGRARRDPQVGLTPPGRAAIAAHAAWLRAQAVAV